MTAGGEFGDLMRRLLVTRMHLSPECEPRSSTARHPALRRSAFVADRAPHRRSTGTLCPNPCSPTAAGSTRSSATASRSSHGAARSMRSAPPRRAPRRGPHRRCRRRTRRWLRRGHVTSAIIRPDRTVMCAGREMREVCDRPAYVQPRHEDAIECLEAPNGVPAYGYEHLHHRRDHRPVPALRRECAGSDPWCGCAATGCMHCPATPSARRC